MHKDDARPSNSAELRTHGIQLTVDFWLLKLEGLRVVVAVRGSHILGRLDVVAWLAGSIRLSHAL